MGQSGFGLALQLVTIVVTILIAVATATWALGKRFEVMQKELRDDFDEKLASLKQEADAAVDKAKREFGETAGSIRNHVTQLELWIRDEVIKKTHAIELTVVEIKTQAKAMIESIGLFQRVVERMERKIERRFNRIENKMDGLPPSAADEDDD